MRSPISVIIPTCGRIDSLSRCLKSLLQQTISPCEIIIVDNSKVQIPPPERSSLQDKLYSHLSGVFRLANSCKLGIGLKLIRENRTGSAFARNAGIKAAKSDLVAFIDDDCEAKRDWIEQIIIAHEQYPDCIIQGRNLNGLPDNIFACLEHFTTESFFIYTRYLDTKNFVLSKSIFKKIGFFDTQFLHILEDVDFALRAKKKDLKILYNPRIKVWHYGRTNLIDHLKREFNKGRDLFYFQKKWLKNIRKNDKLDSILNNYFKKKTKTTEGRIRKDILIGKNFFFKAFFHVLIYIDRLMIRLGFLYSKLHSLYGSKY